MPAVASWRLYVGSTDGAFDYFDSGVTTATSVNVTGLPVNGSTVYVQLFYRPTGGTTWYHIKRQHTAHTTVNVPPTLILPAAVTINSGETAIVTLVAY